MRLEGKGISINYGADIRAVSNIDFIIPEKTVIAFVGKSGAGKTTLADALMGLLVTSQGQIAVDQTGYKLDPQTLYAHRRRIGYVPQEPCLISGTIAENILLGAQDQSRENLERACDLAHATVFIKNLPQGEDTHIGDRGISLSGGQKQRIALARALARKPDFLILDEATSALDNETEKVVHEAISTLRHHITILIIAHRLSTVKDADTIYVMDQGKILQQGRYEQLITQEGVFADLYKHGL